MSLPMVPSRSRHGLLRDKIQTRRNSDSGKLEIFHIEDPFSFEQGIYVVIRACQFLVEKNDGLVLVGCIGPSGAGKTTLIESIRNLMPDIGVLNLADYKLGSRVVKGYFNETVIDYVTLESNIQELKAGESVEVPVYDLQSNSRIGYRTFEVPSSHIVFVEGINVDKRIINLFDLGVSINGGVYLELVKRVRLDIQRNSPEEINDEGRLDHVSETIYPMYKHIEFGMDSAHIKILNKLNLFNGFRNPTYILKSMKAVTPELIKAVMSEGFNERTEETYDIYLLPQLEDPETCQSFLRIRIEDDGKYTLMFEEWIRDDPFIVSSRITSAISFHVFERLLALNYTVATILKRTSHIFNDGNVTVKTDFLDQLNRTYVQIQGKDRFCVKNVANQLGLDDDSYVSHTYIEQIQLENHVHDIMVLPDALKTKLDLDEDADTISSIEALSRAYERSMVKHGYIDDKKASAFPPAPAPATLPNQENVITQLINQVSILNTRMEVLNSKIAMSGSQTLLNEDGNRSHISEILQVVRGQQQIIQQMNNLGAIVPVLLTIANIACFGFFVYNNQK